MATRPVTVTVFNTLTGPINEPVSVLDTNFSNLVNAVDDPLVASNVALDTGSVNAYASTISPGPAVLDTTQVGLEVMLKVANTNTGAATFNLNGFGAKAIVTSTGSAIASGVMYTGMVALLIFNGSTWQLANPVTTTTPSSTNVSFGGLNVYYW